MMTTAAMISRSENGLRRRRTGSWRLIFMILLEPAAIALRDLGRRRNGVASRAGRCIAALVMLRNDKYAEGRVKGSLVLVGLMGVGKSTIGRRLAARLGLPFVDADDEIERAAGMSIQDIFDRHGEPAFRDGERRVIARLIDGPPKVIATGGGAFVNEETRRLILDKATAVWLDADIDVLVGRVSRRDGRPLLKGKNPRDVLMRLSVERTPFYEQAPIRVKSTDSPHDATVEAIVEAIRQ
jgi:shikimate kinase